MQDLLPVLAQAGEIGGVETMLCNIFITQSVKASSLCIITIEKCTFFSAAKFYYLRNGYHNYSNCGCQSILRHAKEAWEQTWQASSMN
jgi:hypothetical protein